MIYLARKCYVQVFNLRKGEVVFEKGKYIDPWIIATKRRILIKTVEPLMFKGKEFYITFEGEPHPIRPDRYFPTIGLPVSGEILQMARKFSKMLQEDYNFADDEELSREIRSKALELANKTNRHLLIAIPAPKHISQMPHFLSEEVIRLVMSRKITAILLKALAFVEKHRVLAATVYFMLGLTMGVLFGIILNTTVFKI